MPDIIFQIGTAAVKQTLTGADLQRVSDHAALAYAPLTGDAAVQQMLADIVAGILGNVVSGEKARAVTTAAAAVQPLKTAEMSAKEAQAVADAEVKAAADAKVAAEAALTPTKGISK